MKASLPQDAAAMFEWAILAAQSIASDYLRGEAFASIAERQAAAGLASEAEATLGHALQVVHLMALQSERDEVLQFIARLHAQAGRFDKTMELLPSLGDERRRNTVLIALAESQAKASMEAEAAATFRRAVENAQSARFFAEGRSGVFQAEGLSEMLTFIAEAQAKAGFAKEAGATFGRALQVASSITDEPGLAWDKTFPEPVIKCVGAIANVANAQARAGMPAEAARTFDQALPLALSITPDVHRALVLKDLADAQARAKLMPVAGATYVQARHAAQAIEKDGQRAAALGPIAKGQAAAGQAAEAAATIDQTMEAMRSITDENNRTAVLRCIMSAHIRLGQFDQALATAQSIASQRSRMDALEELARAQIAAGRFADVLQLASAIEDERRHASVLGNVAIAQARAHRVADALAIVPLINGTYSKAAAVTFIAAAQAEAGLTEGALTVIDQAAQIARTIEDADWRAEALGFIVGKLTSIAGALHA
jgi:tetratricopeptide (TPR) repeat protein